MTMKKEVTSENYIEFVAKGYPVKELKRKISILETHLITSLDKKTSNLIIKYIAAYKNE